MIKSDTSVSNNFDRPKLLLFKFLAHQIHPFAYAVNTFLRPALDDCLELMRSSPQDTFNVLLSLSQTFTRFAPETELIYDDIQQFAIKLKDAMDQCFTQLDPDTIQQSSQLLQSTHENLLEIIHQQATENKTYTNMYKNMSAVLTNLEKINSLPMEMQTMETINPMQKLNINGRKDSIPQHEYASKPIVTPSNRTTTVTPPPGIAPFSNGQSSKIFPPSIPNQTHLSRGQPNSATSMFIPPIDQMKTLTVSSTSSSAPLVTSPKSSLPTRSVPSVDCFNGYEIVDTSTQPLKKPTTTIASFPPRQNASLFTSATPANEKPVATKTIHANGHHSAPLVNDDQPWTQAKPNFQNKVTNGINNNQVRITPTPSIDGSIRFGSVSGLRATSVTSSAHENNDDDDDDDWDESTSQRYNRTNRFATPTSTNSEWNSLKDNRLSIDNQSYFDRTKSLTHPHVTDEYMQEFGTKQNRPALRGELCMTFGTPQSGPQTTCMPIGVGLSYDELTLLSCDVHRSAQHVRLFDIQTGRLKHIISSTPQMKLHRPGAIMSNARNNILIVEKDSIYVTEPDGRLVQTFGHRSVKQLYGIASFRDRYLLTIDSKAVDNQSAEACRILLFDPNSGQLVFDQNIEVNQQSDNIFTSQYKNYIQGNILPESTSKPRFLAVQNDNIYIADLGRSLIYGTSLRNQFDLSCTTVFGGHGRGNGAMHDPSGLFIDSGGNIISADSKNDRVQLFSPMGQYKTTFKLNERIRRPSGICSNRAGTQFYVSCYLAGCVRAFDIGY
ncbi:unnamed protein product [Adineta ricciae]|uniref:Uncharacterized protein n=1 Tax=Adineta ricciae TaxID=249248 RepID=A0A814AWE6_ADIRI|nr:unnamed protein product [Adineta ricciae]CAF1015381.1 unnamed protein product [Adineta ricciae]